MNVKRVHQEIVILILITSSFFGCTKAPIGTTPTTTPISVTRPPITNTAIPPSTFTPELISYEFPDSIDPAKPYMFYLHGKILEDQGIPAVSPEFGEYEYFEILETLAGLGSVVISEQRPKDTDSVRYARKISAQITALLDAGVPAKDITVVGASKGAGIVIYVSHFLDNEDINYVIMGICHPNIVEELVGAEVYLSGNVLSIYDSSDDYAGSCQELFSASDGKGISRYDEVVLDIGTGHGILYQPLDEWILPAVQWAKNNSR